MLQKSIYKVILIGLMIAALLSLDKYPEFDTKAAFIEKISRYIGWPEVKGLENKSSIKIGVMGKSNINNSLNKYFNKAKIKNKNVKIVEVINLDDINELDILYIAEDLKDELDAVIERCFENGVLVISDIKGYCMRGVHINFFNDKSRLNFEVNLGSIRKSQFYIDSKLLAIAKVVE